MLDIAASTVYASDNVDVVLTNAEKPCLHLERYTWLPLGISGGMADGFNYIGNLALTTKLHAR